MTTLYLIRHGETDWNTEGRWQGQADVPLNQKGLDQAKTIAKNLRSLDLKSIVSSDLARASQTANFLALEKGLDVNLDSRLREIHMGSWQGLLISEIQIRYADEYKKRQENPWEFAPPGGETALQVQNRALSSINEIITKYPGDHIAVFSHGFAIATILTYIYKIPLNKIWDLVPQNGQIKEMAINNLKI
jgi:broad specificity phosphatase PhoE